AANLLRSPSSPRCAAMASRSRLIPSGLVRYAVSAPLDNSHPLIDLRHLRSNGPHKSPATSAIAGWARPSQNERSAFLACAGEPVANALATIAALMAPALVPLSCAMATLRLANRASNIPH